MNKYKKINLISSEFKINEVYNELLLNKWQFVILDIEGKLMVLTKEKSLLVINDEQEFLKSLSQDVYYKSIVKHKNENIDMKDIKLFYDYINKYKNNLERNLYGGKYLFGSIAIKTHNGFITTIRGKENLNDYTLVSNVNHISHEVEVVNKKATLNAPLLDYIFKKMKNVKIIVHLNGEFDNSLPYFDYAFPGTERDSIRDVCESFNIKCHGVFYLFDGNKKLI